MHPMLLLVRGQLVKARCLREVRVEDHKQRCKFNFVTNLQHSITTVDIVWRCRWRFNLFTRIPIVFFVFFRFFCRGDYRWVLSSSTEVFFSYFYFWSFVSLCVLFSTNIFLRLFVNCQRIRVVKEYRRISKMYSWINWVIWNSRMDLTEALRYW